MSTSQNAFAKGRYISDAAPSANEVVDLMRKQGLASVLCKLDLEKEYDHVSWNFQDFIMIQMKFGENGENGKKFTFLL